VSFIPARSEGCGAMFTPLEVEALPPLAGGYKVAVMEG
jgi:hypothetical protein